MGKYFKAGDLYRPSNGTEECWFIEEHCCNCIHGKYEHTGDVNDTPCEILTASFMCDIDEPLYPKELVYDDNDCGICTAFKKWDWERDDDGNFKNEPPLEPIDDPNQLCLPFIFDELQIPKHKLETV